MRATKSSGRSRAVAQRQERALRVGVRQHPRGQRSPRRRRAARPTARPPRVTTCSTSASQRISHPASRAASAIVAVSTPMPPRTKPHCRTPPSTSSLAWSCSSTYAVPGRRRTRDAVVDRVPSERRLHVLALEPLRQELVRARREEEREVGEALALAQPDAVPTSPARARSRQRAHARIGRRPVERGQHRLHELRRGRPRTAAAPARRRSENRRVASTLAAMSSPR